MADYGKKKSNRYAFATSQFEKAMEAGFYLEAITITESMISDRLLASQRHLEGKEHKASTGLRRLLEMHLKDQKLRAESGNPDEKGKAIFGELMTWCEQRNDLLHGVAKFQPGSEDELETTEQLMERARTRADEGLHLFRRLDSWLRRERTRHAA